ncbi:MAG: YqaA family protein [Alphaproteobacteria bacterium]|jgi:membrane protein YqaA with SNARE-associated domain
MLRALYNWTMDLAGHRHANWALGAVSFIESSVFPIPPDVMLIPMVLARRHKALLIATICTVASVLGGLLGYAIGYYLFDAIGQPILNFYGYGEKFASFQSRYNEWGVWIVLIAGVTPFPYKVITIASGVTGLSLPVFLLASIVARGLRFAIVTALLWRFGEPIREFIERYLGILFTVFMVLLIGGFAAVKLVF